MEAKAKGWMAASAAMLALSILVATGPIISTAISQRSFSEAYGTIPQNGTCGDKLGVFINSQRDFSTIFLKSVRDYFEQQTGCVVEDTPYERGSGGTYARQFFPQIQDFNYTILDANPYRVGGSFGSIPAWKVRVRYEVEIESDSEWGLCEANGPTIESGDYADPSWPADALGTYARQGNFNESRQFQSRYSVSYERDIRVTDQEGPWLWVELPICGTDDIFQNSRDAGYSWIYASFAMDPADLAPYNIPFYSWMGW